MLSLAFASVCVPGPWHQWHVLRSHCSLGAKAAASSRRDSDSHLQDPRDSELPAPMAQGEGKIFSNSGLFWFSGIPWAAPGVPLLVCAIWKWLQL